MAMEVESSVEGQHLTYGAADSVISGSSFTVVNADNWVFVGAAKATGSAAPDFYKWVYGTATESLSTGGVLANGSAPGTTGTMRIGEWQDLDDFGGDIAGVAYYGRKLTTDEFRSMRWNFWDWLRLGPAGMWVLDQIVTTNPIYDLTGNGSNETTRTGTTVSTNSAPIGWGSGPMRVTRQAAAVAGLMPQIWM